MSRHTLTDAEAFTVINALRLAAERYDANAATVRAEVIPETAGLERIAEQFDRQAAAACALADRIENDDDEEPDFYNDRDDDRAEDTGRYSGGYRTFRDGSCREDFGADR